MPKQTDLAALAARVAALEEQLAVIVRVPMIAYRLSEHCAWQTQRLREAAAEAEAVEAYKAAAPKRAERFKEFVSARLTFGAHCRTLPEFCHAAYVQWGDEVGLSRVERLEKHEFIALLLKRPDVIAGRASTYVGGKRDDALLGVAVAEAFRDERDAADDQDLGRRVSRQRMIAAMNPQEQAARLREHEILSGAPGV
jgi:hypothetical protein